MNHVKNAISLLLAVLLLSGAAPARAAATPEALLARMRTEDKISQLLMPAFRYYPDRNGKRQNVTALPADIAATLAAHPFAGVVLFAQNTGDTADAVKLVADMQAANAAVQGRPQLLIAIDQEGGRVTRLGHGTQMPGNMALGAANDAALTAQAASIIGAELLSMGINFNFAPVLDVNNDPANPVIGTRSFSDEAQLVAAQGVSYMQALQGTGVISTLKHFPGHGDTATDSHTGLPRIDKSYAELQQNELIPFQAAIDAGADAIMTAHIQYPQIERGTYRSKKTGAQITLPATLSKTILTDILRGDMGFDGVVISDAMNMDAIAGHFDPYDAAKLALAAGVDILLMPVDCSTAAGLAALERYIQTLAGMVDSGALDEARVNAAVLRVLKLKAAHALTQPYAPPDADAAQTVGSAAHHEAEWALTKQTITLVKNDGQVLPLTRENQNIAVLTAYDNEVASMEYAIGRLRDEGKLAPGSEITVRSLRRLSRTQALALAEGADCAILITELGSEAELRGDAAATTDALIDAVHRAGGSAVVMSCSLPYDAARYQSADAIVLAWSARGMSEDPRIADGAVAQYGPSMPAALYLMLSPDETPTALLPVNIPMLTDTLTYADEVLYPRGFGLRYGAVLPFADVDAAAWYAPGAHYCAEHGLMNGVGNAMFAPSLTVSRAMLATVLWRMAGSPAADGATPFSDVPDGTWYTAAVRWAAESGTVTGYAGRFAPNDPVTREQLAVMLRRFAAPGDEGGTAELSAYADAGDVSGWAQAGMAWAVRSGIVNGSDGRLAPQGNTTRAEAATMLMRFCQRTA